MGRKTRGIMKRPMKINKQTSNQKPQFAKPKSIDEKLAKTVTVPQVFTKTENTANIQNFKKNAAALYKQEQDRIQQLKQEQDKPEDFSQLFKGEQKTTKQQKTKDLTNIQSYNPDIQQFSNLQQIAAIEILQQDLNVSKAAVTIGKTANKKKELEELTNYYKQLLNMPTQETVDMEQVKFQLVKEKIQEEINQLESDLQELSQNYKQSQILDFINQQIKQCQQLIELHDENVKTINKLMKGDKTQFMVQTQQTSMSLQSQIRKLNQIKTIITQKQCEKQLEQKQQPIINSQVIPQVNTQDELSGSLRKVIPIQPLQETNQIITDSQQKQLDARNKHILKITH